MVHTCLTITGLFLLGLLQLANTAHIPVTATGLYDENDDVVIYTSKNLDENIYEKPYGTLLEFYNSFCGHCRNYAPHYKNFSSDILRWNRFIKVGAIDCAADENLEKCTEYEINAYPTLRYFHVFQKANISYGDNIKLSDEDGLRESMLAKLVDEKVSLELWPTLQPIELNSTNLLFRRLPSRVKYVFLIYGLKDDPIPSYVQLDLESVRDISVRRVNSVAIARNLGIYGEDKVLKDSTQSNRSCGYVDRNNNVKQISINSLTREELRASILNELRELNIKVPKWVVDNKQIKSMPSIPSERSINRATIIQYVKQSPGTIYLSDIQTALHFTLFNEIPKVKDIKGDKLDALKNFIHVLKSYTRMNHRIDNFLSDLDEYVAQSGNHITGYDYNTKVHDLNTKAGDIFRNTGLIGCTGSGSGYRGYTCGLWQLFHHLTVEAAANPVNNNGNEVLSAMYGYVQSFFGCSDCAAHFKDMSTGKKLFDVTDHQDAVMWLWEAHNQVNERLSGDSTDDPEFPKIQYPSTEMCSDCKTESQWNRERVKEYLMHQYKTVNLNKIDDEALKEQLSNDGSRIKMSNVVSSFDDIDKRLGIFLYVFCIFILLAAVKKFLCPRYKKKPYMHDYWGKV